jgi:TatA/E family protein of Tat protein translocase
LLIVLGIVLLIFGSRLPNLARSMGKSITEFKRGMNDEDASADRLEQK